MNALRRRLSSVRVRLTLWNTLTFALVLVALGVTFRFLAENYLLNALDREIKLQAGRLQESHRIETMVLRTTTSTNNLTLKMLMEAPRPPYPSETLRVLKDVPMTQTWTPSPPPAVIHGYAETGKESYAPIIKKIQTTGLDQSGQFLYRSFDLAGKPLSPLKLMGFLRIAFPNPEGLVDIQEQMKEYQPWDRGAFSLAARGTTRFSTVNSAGSRLRVLSLPLRDGDKIIGVAQIATPLAQVYRDIAGLTKLLALTLPLALLVAVGAGVFLTGRALRPVKSLAQAAAELRPDQLTQRLPVSGADEFDELASTFNHALDRVELAFLEREKMMDQLRRFTGDASHELRTPLTTIKANTGVALTEQEPSPEHIHALRQIDRAADRMTALVQDLLLLARTDADQAPLDRHPVSLHEVLCEAVEALPAPPARPPIRLPAGEPALTLCGNSDQLRRLFLNLLENAVRFTPADGEIQVRMEPQQAWAIVHIQIRGAASHQEHLPHLGERFYRADAGRNRRHGGAGLGLAICRSIVARHHGEISIASQPGEGTTVTVRLPLSA